MTTSGSSAASGSARPMRADARRNRAKLIGVAREAFAAHGMDASLDDIAKHAGVGPGTLYRHFPTRDTLIEAVYREDVAALAARGEALVAEVSPAEALAGWIRDLVAFVINDHGLGTAMKESLDTSSEVFQWCSSRLRAASAAVADNATEHGALRPDVSGSDLLRLGHSLRNAVAGAELDVDRMLSLLLDGLRPREEH